MSLFFLALLPRKQSRNMFAVVTTIKDPGKPSLVCGNRCLISLETVNGNKQERVLGALKPARSTSTTLYFVSNANEQT